MDDISLNNDNIILENTPRIKNEYEIDFLQYFYNRWCNLKINSISCDDDDDDTISGPLEIEMFHKDWIKQNYNESNSPCSSHSCTSLFSESGGKYRKWPTK